MTELYWGVSAGSHDAALSVVCGNEILFASSAERFSRIKNDPDLNHELINYALKFGKPSKIFYYEKSWLKKTRQLYAGQYHSLFKPSIASILREFGVVSPVKEVSHHLSHAAGGYYTSKFDSAAVVVIDAIGEWETLSIWHAQGNKLKKLYSESYPNSLGLWYSAMTQRIGLRPNEEEYILMGMSAFGDNKYYDFMLHDFFDISSKNLIKLNNNLHKGCKHWRVELIDTFNIAKSTQSLFENYLIKIMNYAKSLTNEKNLVYMGGCALNCLANSQLVNIFDNIWIMPNPGDSGSSIGAIAAGLSTHLTWRSPLLGYDISGKYPIEDAIEILTKDGIVGVAAGKAEFGPRALGNRSLLADPRSIDIKSAVNSIKKRQQFRPFAPAILEEYANDYFEMPMPASPYMQYVSVCKTPSAFPAITHVDGTSRVQTVNKTDYPDFYKLLQAWYQATGCPMLLNTSLNIRGEPLVNTQYDGECFSKKYNTPVLFSKNT
ncbi:MAG: hypothetical protein HC836_16560 [Richelia sp. RM2_1_2]|nr:hypothetical protein [Richelia sp. RM2_1_2]